MGRVDVGDGIWSGGVGAWSDGYVVFNEAAASEIYTLALHDAVPI